MSKSGQTFNARTLGLTTSRLSLCVLWALLLWAPVNGQDGCTTFPCSISLAQYSLAPPPLSVGQSSSAPPRPAPTPTTSSTSTSSTTSSSSSSSSSASSTKSSSIVSSSSSSSSSPVSYPAGITSQTPSSTVSSNGGPTSPSPNVPSSQTQTVQSSSNLASSPTTTQLRLPTFSTSSSTLPSITKGPSLNSTSSNSTSSTQCGQCSVAAEQVQVYYWPTASVNSNCARASAATPYPSNPKYATNATTNATQTLTALASAGATDVINGFTYTFPSTYVSVVGKIAVSNSCGVLGQTHTNPPPVAVQAITTASYASWPSSCRPQGNYVDAVIDTLDIADIACPTWGLSDPFYTSCDGDTYLTATEGPPYNPVILVPTQFLNYDPSWGKCTQVSTNGPFLMPCGVYDPPRTLSAAGGLGPQTEASGPVAPKVPGVLSAAPALVPASNAAQPTPAPQPQPQAAQDPAPQAQSPANGDPGQSPPASNPSPSPNQGDPGSGSQGQSDPSQSDPGQSDPGQSSGSSGAGDGSPNDPDPSQGAGAGSSAGGSTGESSGGSNNQPTDPQTPSGSDPPAAAPEPQPVPQTTINLGGQSTGGIGSIINSAFGANPSPATPQNAGSQGENGGSNSGSNPGGSTGGSSGSSAGGSGSSAPGAGSPGNSDGSSDGNSGGSGSPANGAVFTPHAITALGAALSALNPSAVAIGGKTLSAGGPAFTTNSNYYSVGPSGNLVAGTLAPGATPAPAALTFGGQTYTANSAGQIVVAGQTLAPGVAITVSGTPISEAAGGAFAVVGGSTQSLITPAPSQGPALLTFGGSTYTANAASQFVIGGQTLTPGGQITVSGTALSEGPSGSGVVVVGGSSTVSLGHGGAAMVTNAAVMSFGGQSYTANAAGDFVVDGQTLTPGGVITVSGTPISEGTGASDVVIGSSTEMLSSAAVMVTSAAVMTFDGQTYTADAQGDFTIDGQILTPGGVITVSGTPISEAQDATDVVIGTSTEALSTTAATQSAMAFEGRGGRIKTPTFMELLTLFGLTMGSWMY